MTSSLNPEAADKFRRYQMPFASKKQEGYLWANEPEVARKFARHTKKKKKKDAYLHEKD